MNSPVSAIEAIEKAMEGVTPGPWDVWEERTPAKADAVAEMTYQVENSEPFAGAVYLLNANGKCPATTGCGPTSAVNAAYIAACNPVAMREVLALARKAEALQRENADKDARIAALTKGLTPFARIADMTRDNATGASVMVNVDRCRDASALLGGSDAE